jgi:hypothetical protein
VSHELEWWMNDQATLAEGETPDEKVPPEVIRDMIARSVMVNWPRHMAGHDDNGRPYAITIGSPSAANKALEMLAKDSGMLEDRVDVSGSIEVKIVGVDVEDLR